MTYMSQSAWLQSHHSASNLAVRHFIHMQYSEHWIWAVVAKSLCSKTVKFNSSWLESNPNFGQSSDSIWLTGSGYFRPDSAYQNTLFRVILLHWSHKYWSGTLRFSFFYVCAAARDGRRRTDGETFPEKYRAYKLQETSWSDDTQSSRSQVRWQTVATQLTCM